MIQFKTLIEKTDDFSKACGGIVDLNDNFMHTKSFMGHDTHL